MAGEKAGMTSVKQIVVVQFRQLKATLLMHAPGNHQAIYSCNKKPLFIFLRDQYNIIFELEGKCTF
jgi:hypothetical protein